MGCDEGERVMRTTEKKARGADVWSRRFASDRTDGRDVIRTYLH